MEPINLCAAEQLHISTFSSIWDLCVNQSWRLQFQSFLTYRAEWQMDFISIPGALQCLYDAKHTAFDGKLQNEPCVPTHATTVVSALKIMYRMCQKSNHPQVLADNSSMASFACIYCVWILNNYINLPANFIGNKHAVAFIMPLPLDRGIKQLCIWRLSHTSGLSREQGGLGRLKLAQR